MKLAALFSDNAVLQRDRAVPIWGWSKPGESVTVEFAGQKKTASADATGKWLVQLDPLPASAEPRELHAGSCRIQNILVGDVWLCSGQSNMQWEVNLTNNAVAEIAAANHPLLRLFTVPNKALLGRQTDVDSHWQTCSPATVKTFSAVGYFFGREIAHQAGVPVGLINSSWGGTRIETWMSRDALLTDADCRLEIEDYEKWLHSPEGQQQIQDGRDRVEDLEAWEHKQGQPDPGNTGHGKKWAAREFDDSAWPEMPVPIGWQMHGLKHNGVLWFRRTVDVPADWAGQDLILHLGACDKTDTTYFNNVQVGAIGFETKSSWNTPRVYRIPGHLVQPGRNVIASRVYSNLYEGGLIGPAATMRLERNGTKLPLAGLWRYQVEHDLGLAVPKAANLGPGNPNTIYILNDSMIQPLVPAALCGAIWYQGESNAGQPRRYRDLFTLMIRDWRKTFANDTLPFFFVQLANYMGEQKTPIENGWAELREAQNLALRLPNTGMASAIDIGEANDIHPRNKQDVGKRLALAALAGVYGKQVNHTGPLYKAHRVEGDTTRIEFDHVADGLKSAEPLKGFAIAGVDGKFHWAEAHIDGKTVVVRGHGAIRYSWANNPIGNLVNSAGLPASPFRTDID
ncbi:MAG: sialate O-acetylesterase [Verrucomicrobiota bacterium]